MLILLDDIDINVAAKKLIKIKAKKTKKLKKFQILLKRKNKFHQFAIDKYA